MIKQLTAINKLVFLDFDGCLNNDETFKHYRHPPIDPMLVRRVDGLIAATGAHIVISSAWRNFYALTQLQQWLGERGLRAPRRTIIGRTPHFPDQPRGHEIQSYLNAFRRQQIMPDERIVILDDWGVEEMVHLTHRLVQTDERIGLQPSDVQRAIDLLVTPLEFQADNKAENVA